MADDAQKQFHLQFKENYGYYLDENGKPIIPVGCPPSLPPANADHAQGSSSGANLKKYVCKFCWDSYGHACSQDDSTDEAGRWCRKHVVTYHLKPGKMLKMDRLIHLRNQLHRQAHNPNEEHEDDLKEKIRLLLDQIEYEDSAISVVDKE